MDVSLINPSLFAAGGMIAFAGGEDPMRAGIGALLSAIIGDVERDPNKDSHVAILLPQAAWLSADRPEIFESTIEAGVSGPQYNLLIPTLQRYQKQGGAARYFPFASGYKPDWSAVLGIADQMVAQQKAGRLHYGVLHLVADLDARQVWLQRVIDKITGGSSYERLMQLMLTGHGIVCSECVASVLETGGIKAQVIAAGKRWLPDSRPYAGQPIGCTPLDCIAIPAWTSPANLIQ